MKATTLYKYLDLQGGWAMLNHSNLQFTNATQLNDPLDCHTSLIDCSNAPKEACNGWPAEWIEDANKLSLSNTRNDAWLCSLSKKYDSLLMWSYYNQHKGICIGLNMEKLRKYTSRMLGKIMIGCAEVEVQYKSIIEKPNYFRDSEDFYHYQLATKANEWEHEQEVRLLILSPWPTYMVRKIQPNFPKNNDTEPQDWRKERAYLNIGGECFESLYMGINIDVKKKAQIIEVARKLNPNIKIYQMGIDENSFNLTTKIIAEDKD